MKLGRRAFLVGVAATTLAPATEPLVELLKRQVSGAKREFENAMAEPFFGVDRSVYPTTLRGWRASPLTVAAVDRAAGVVTLAGIEAWAPARSDDYLFREAHA